MIKQTIIAALIISMLIIPAMAVDESNLNLGIAHHHGNLKIIENTHSLPGQVHHNIPHALRIFNIVKQHIKSSGVVVVY